ncbi:hypothetical protein ACHHYP_07728 [Achlya hypogyna]|uniref:Secreted protein n=1 Tax=Achlya hypogyna TaxID=1202772 RepID=A0A1V9ZLI0_ACHHY|nr:hypothetical protein ACHHYP_07728 [Achlya hypogyna]
MLRSATGLAVALGAASASFHSGTYICDTWDAWNCFPKVPTIVRWAANGVDVECMSLDGKVCVATPMPSSCIQLKRQPPTTATSIVCPKVLPADKTFDWCIEAKAGLKGLDETTVVTAEPKPKPKPKTTHPPTTTSGASYGTPTPATLAPYVPKPTTTPYATPKLPTVAPKTNTATPYEPSKPNTVAPKTTTEAPKPTTSTPKPTTTTSYVAPKPTTTWPYNASKPTTVTPKPATSAPKPTTAGPYVTPKPTTLAPNPTTVAPAAVRNIEAYFCGAEAYNSDAEVYDGGSERHTETNNGSASADDGCDEASNYGAVLHSQTHNADDCGDIEACHSDTNTDIPVALRHAQANNNDYRAYYSGAKADDCCSV